jgi:nitrite reductase/ring-hydroxylating ferredoxin subunit
MSDASASRRLDQTPAGVRLGPLALIPDRKARNFVLQIGDGRFHGFVVRLGGTARGYLDRCPHAGLPLAQQLDNYMTADGAFIVCSWHGALFDPGNGLCVGGPCAGARLTPWPVDVCDGTVFTAKEPAT